MNIETLTTFHKQFDALQNEISSFHGEITKLSKLLDEGKIINPADVDECRQWLDQYEKVYSAWHATGEELPFNLSGSVPEIREAIAKAEREQLQETMRNTVLDYLRLCTDDEEDAQNLHESKQILAAGCPTADEDFLKPYACVVKHVKQNLERLSKEDYRLIDRKIGLEVVRMADHDELHFGNDYLLNEWLTGFCPLLKPLNHDRPEIGPEFQMPPPDGFISDASFSYIDVSEEKFSQAEMNEYSKKGVWVASSLLRLFNLKLIPADQATQAHNPITGENPYQYLKEKGMITTVKIKGRQSGREYIMLTSKGVACMKKINPANVFGRSSSNAGLKAIMIEPKEMSAVFAWQAALLSNLICRSMDMDYSAVFAFNPGRTNPIAVSVNKISKKSVMLVPYFFDKKHGEEQEKKFIGDYIKLKPENPCRILCCSEYDAGILKKHLEQEKAFGPELQALTEIYIVSDNLKADSPMRAYTPEEDK